VNRGDSEKSKITKTSAIQRQSLLKPSIVRFGVEAGHQKPLSPAESHLVITAWVLVFSA
jgi:hypothetical protein